MSRNSAPSAASGRRSFSGVSTYVFEHLMPDPLLLAILLTAMVAVAAFLSAPNGSAPVILTAWYDGIFNILGFAFQMILILVTGHALAHAPPVQAGLRWLVGHLKTPTQAVCAAFLLSAAASWLNWGFGLVIGAVIAREIAKRMRIDFAWLVAAAYSGWVIWASGLSSSIALTQASHGNALNIVEKVTGRVLPLSETILAPFNLIPTLLLLVLAPLALLAVRPREDEVEAFQPGPEPQADLSAPARAVTFAGRLDRSRVGSLLVVGAGVAYLALTWAQKGISFDVNTLIFLFLICGLALHGAPIAYGAAIKSAASQAGSMILQYPLYGGIMGIMTATGLAKRISEGFVSVATAHTLPFLSYLCSLLITFMVPSGGGHWAVQGPFTVAAAVSLHASLPATAMAVAMGEQVSNMLQPFWVLPVAAIAGIGIRRVMGFTVVTFAVSAVVYGVAMLVMPMA